MYNDDELQFLTPKMAIEYRTEAGFLNDGTFDNVPENAFGAHIIASFPVVSADGKFRNFFASYDLFVGKVLELKELLEQMNNSTDTVGVAISKEKIKEYQEAGIQNVVSTKNGIAPLGFRDAVFASQEEMAVAVNKIDQTFKSINISLQNAEIQKIQK